MPQKVREPPRTPQGAIKLNAGLDPRPFVAKHDSAGSWQLAQCLNPTPGSASIFPASRASSLAAARISSWNNRHPALIRLR
jgi:hypothetical protein